MKKQYIAGILCVLIIAMLPLATSRTIDSDPIIPKESETQALFGVTFIAGFIYNPERVGNIIRAKAVFLGYYDRGLLIKDSGIAIGLKDVRFRDGNMLYMSDPGEFGIVQVVGICTGFHVFE
jgi:hypothetical protein